MTKRPRTTIAAGAITSAVVVLIVWCARQFGGVELPGEVVAALSTLVGVGVAYLVPLAPGEAI